MNATLSDPRFANNTGAFNSLATILNGSYDNGTLLDNRPPALFATYLATRP